MNKMHDISTTNTSFSCIYPVLRINFSTVNLTRTVLLIFKVLNISKLHTNCHFVILNGATRSPLQGPTH